MYNKNDEIFIMTKRSGYIPQLRMYGPIPNPLKCPIQLCMSMLIAGVELHQYDPKTKMVVKLTIENLYDDKKFVKDEVKEEPKKPEMKNIETKTVKGVTVKKEEVPEKIDIKTETFSIKDEVEETAKVVEDIKEEPKEEQKKKTTNKKK